MPYTLEETRTSLQVELSDEVARRLEEFLKTGEAKYINFILFRAFLKVATKHSNYEDWRKLKSVLNDVRDEYVSRMNDYERGARERNGDVI